MSRFPYVVLAAAVSLVLLVGGFQAGASHRGQMLVPVEKGVPADLPYWACDEITEARYDNLVTSVREDVESQYRRGPMPPVSMGFEDGGYYGSCPGKPDDDLGAGE